MDNDWVARGTLGDGKTEYGAQYPGKEGTRSRPIRPAETLLNSGEFNGETTNKADFNEKFVSV
ncbi:unnamed protein product [Heligmosomoides polygyrus]|uniref:Transposase n=1 Tax=Heligmosomoides polygyrus TaxID=6339 RepID=A0A183F8N9_HELPZ|nr:unnamed protein product [Heligmosomoides polygyrus]